MKVLVAYATRHGSTTGIAERVAAGLRAAGVDAEARPVGQVRSLDGYEGVVVGGAAYMFHWLKDATAFVHKNREALSERPVWLFSSGPLGTDALDEQGRSVFEALRPQEWAALPGLIGSRGERVFRGAWDAEAPPIGLGERMLRFMPKARAAMPVGDFREWPEIDAWAAEIAASLHDDGADAA